MTNTSHPQPTAASAQATIGARRHARSAGAVRRLLLALVGVLSLGVAPIACSHGAKKPAQATEPVEPATVEVQNRHGTDVVIFTVRGNTRTRLGQVSVGATQRYTLPLVFVGDIGGFTLVADPIGEREGVQTQRLIVQSGQRVVWSLEARLAQSSVGIF